MTEEVDTFEHFFEMPWSDGLPVVSPTDERIAQMLGGTGRDPAEVIGEIPPANHEATIHNIAVHAVMAGCKSAYLPVVVGALEAMLIKRFNLIGIQATMFSGGPLLILNGPYAKKIGVHAGSGCFGPGFRANLTIGRAIRLVMMNLGGGIPGVSDMSTFGSPSKIAYCVRENEEQSPWPPLAADHGYKAGEDVLTVFNAEPPRLAMDDVSSKPDGVLTTIASTMSTMGSTNAYTRVNLGIVIAPDHAQILDEGGLSRDDIKRELFERARLPVGLLKRGGRYRGPKLSRWPDWVDHGDDNFMVPIVHDPDDILLFVAGGIPGPSTLVIPGWNTSSQAITTSYRTD
jgi:hypothetical protein